MPWSGCWIWMGRTDKKGYGTFDLINGSIRAHRFSYELKNNPIPDGMELDHRCRVRCCVNPDHLEPVTHLENMARSRGYNFVTHCSRGHPFTEQNIYLIERNRYGTVNQERRCRKCAAILDKKRAAEGKKREYYLRTKRPRTPEEAKKHKEYMRQYHAKRREALLQSRSGGAHQGRGEASALCPVDKTAPSEASVAESLDKLSLVPAEQLPLFP